MKLGKLRPDHYRCLRDGDIEFGDLNLFIGANASGKSTVLDALRFLSEGVRLRDFRIPTQRRGGIIHLAWKGEDAGRVGLAVSLEDGDRRYEWVLKLIRNRYEFHVEERIEQSIAGNPPVTLLSAERGEGWWWSGKDGRVALQQSPTTCALAAAAADAHFPARGIAAFISRWGFFDPNPFLLRRDWTGLVADGLDPYGRNLAETLYALDAAGLERVVEATRAIIGLPERIDPRKSEDDERYFFVQWELGHQYSVHQMGVSSGTLRILALMTALVADSEANLIGIEEPENNIHPAALSAFMELIGRVQGRAQIVVTTHSPLLLNFLDEPRAIRVVQRDNTKGTVIVSENPDAIRRALDESGFRLGEYYETTGFGSE